MPAAPAGTDLAPSLVGQIEPADTVTFITQAHELGLESKLITYDGALDEFLMDTDLDLDILEGLYSFDWDVASPDFYRLYAENIGRLADKSAHRVFDAVHILMEGITDKAHGQNITSLASF